MARTRLAFVAVGLVASACADTRDPEGGDSLGSMTATSAGSASEAGETAGDDEAGTTASSLDDADDDAADDAKFDVAMTGDGGFDPDTSTSCEQDIDIVFVMDVSTSMGPFLSKLADEILVVDQAIAALQLPNPPHYGLVVFVDDAAILNTGAPYPDVETLRADFMEWSAFTSSNQQVGGGNFNSTWPENSLDAIHLAAAGFQWRPQGDGTLRMIIHTTDDTFWDGPTTGNGVAIEHGYEEVVAALQEREIRMFTFAAQIGGSCECEDVTPGWSTPYMGLPPIPESTDGEVFDIDLVLAGQVSLSEAINGAIEDNMCEPYPPQG